VDDLAAFLNARLDDVEVSDWHARDCQTHRQMPANSPLGLVGVPLSCNCRVPDWLLADVAAKREIVKLCAWVNLDENRKFSELMAGRAQEARSVLRELALPYAYHPDYREEWRP